MYRRFREDLKTNPVSHHRTHLQNMELEWAHIFHDSIRGKPWLQSLPLNVGRWAGNYSFFYVLCRLLNDYKAKSIIEFGLGESSKVVAAFIEHQLLDCRHTIIEENKDWRDSFLNRFPLSDRSEIKILPAEQKQAAGGAMYKGYASIDTAVAETFDLYLVDGPTGSERFSRYDIVTIAKQLHNGDEFVILIDDYDRAGEKETTEALLELFKQRGIHVHTGVYMGNASQIVIATGRYQFATTM